MAISVRQMRWMGLCAVLGGVLMVGENLEGVVFGPIGRVYTSETSWHLAGTAGAIVWGLGVLSMFLSILGVVGLYLRQRTRANKAGSAGFILLVAGFAGIITGSAVAMTFAEGRTVDVVASILVIPGTFMIPPAFLLLGFGMPSPSRRLPLLFGWYFVVRMVFFLAARGLGRREVPVGLGIATDILLGLGLAVIGYSIWSGTRVASGSEVNP